MQIYSIKFKKDTLKFINSRSPKERQRIFNAVYKLPYAKHVKKMQGYENRYRLRIGNVRVQYERYDDVFIVLVIKADNRGDAY